MQENVSFTSSILKGLTMASIFFINSKVRQLERRRKAKRPCVQPPDQPSGNRPPFLGSTSRISALPGCRSVLPSYITQPLLLTAGLDFEVRSQKHRELMR